jgi:hypothetical protein
MSGLATREVDQPSTFDGINPSLLDGICAGAYVDYNLACVEALCGGCT